MELHPAVVVLGSMYLVFTALVSLWGVLVFRQWANTDPAKPATIMQNYMPWMARVHGDATEPMNPTPRDIALAVVLTITPIVQCAVFLPAGMLTLCALIDEDLQRMDARNKAKLEELKARLGKHPNIRRWVAWAHRPIRQERTDAR